MPHNRIVFTVTLEELAEVPGTPYAYWAPPSLRKLFRKYPPLDRDVAGRPDQPKIADVKVGLQTSDDLRFTRFWWEVPVEQIAIRREETLQGKKWVPFAKGGKPFYYDLALVVNWGNNGEEIRNFPNAVIRNEAFYFREGLAWARMVTSGRLDFAPVSVGCVFSHAGGGGLLFLRDEAGMFQVCAALNSYLKFAAFLLMNPLAHGKETGVIARLPVAPVVSKNERLFSLAHEAHDLLREWDTGNEVSTQFIKPWLLQVWDAVQGVWDEATAKPVTGHPLTADFTWSEWESARRIRGLTPTLALPHQGGGVKIGLRVLAEACVERERLLRQRLEEIQQQIDDEVYRLYEISEEDRQRIELELALRQRQLLAEEIEEGMTEEAGEQEAALEPEVEVTLDVAEHVRRLLSYFVKLELEAESGGIVPYEDTHRVGSVEEGLVNRVRRRLAQAFGEDHLEALEEELASILGKSLDAWLAEDYFNHHVTLYRRRPIVWHFTSAQLGRKRGAKAGAFSCFVWYHKLERDTLNRILAFFLPPVKDQKTRERDQVYAHLQEAKKGGPRRLISRLESQYADAVAAVEELEAFEQALQDLLRPAEVFLRSDARWVDRAQASVRRDGYRPVLDSGVRANIEPLKQAKVLHPAADRVK